MKTPLCVSGTQCVIYTWQCSWWHHWWPQHKHINAPTVSPSHRLGLRDKRQQGKTETWLPDNMDNKYNHSLKNRTKMFQSVGTFTFRDKTPKLSSVDNTLQEYRHVSVSFPFPSELILSLASCWYVLTAKQTVPKWLFSPHCFKASRQTCGINVGAAVICHREGSTTAHWNSLELIH